VSCFKSLCSALCAIVRSSYGPCARASSAAELVYGRPARKAVLELEDMRAVISQCRTRWVAPQHRNAHDKCAAGQLTVSTKSAVTVRMCVPVKHEGHAHAWLHDAGCRRMWRISCETA
jgi:hypothetical protein